MILPGVRIKEGDSSSHTPNQGKEPEGKGKMKVSACYSTEEEDEEDGWIHQP